VARDNTNFPTKVSTRKEILWSRRGDVDYSLEFNIFTFGLSASCPEIVAEMSRRITYSLRSLFVLIALIAIPLCIVNVELRSMRTRFASEQAIVIRIEELGGTVNRGVYEPGSDLPRTTWLPRFIVGRLYPNEDLPVTRVQFEHCTVDATTIQSLELHELHDLEMLILRDCPLIDDEIASVLKDLPRIKVLDLSGTTITDAIVPQLAELKHLRRISVLNTKTSKDAWKDFTNCRVSRGNY